jgi:hypothetical protein
MASIVHGTPEDRSFEYYVEANADAVAALPDGEFTRDEIDDRLADELDKLRSKGIIDRVDTEIRDGDSRSRSTYEVAVFAVVEQARSVAKRVTDTRDAITPCGHGGLSNCGDHYECQADFCAREFAAEDLEVDR